MSEQTTFQSPTSHGRKVRPEHERDHPFRNASRILDGARASAAVGDDDVAAGVRGAYDVIEKYLSEGADLAMKLGKASYGSLGELGDLPSRMGLLSSELVANWFELLGTMSDAVLNSTGGAAGSPPAADASIAPPRHALQVDGASRPCSADITLHRAAAVPDLHCAGLIGAQDGALLPLALATADNGTLIVRVSLSADTTVGAYHGVLIDRANHQPCGLLQLDVVA